MASVQSATIAAGEPAATLARLAGRAHELLPVLRERAARTEQLRHLPEETVREFREAGFFRIFQPRRYGGFELDYGPAQLALGGEIGQACGSSAWVLTVVACHSWMLGMFPREAQDEVWGERPDDLLSSGVFPDRSEIVPAKGGLTVSGRWRFSSGVDHVQWAVLGAPLRAEKGPPSLVWIVVPRRDFEIRDTWRVAGLAGTGSNDIEIAGAFVPDHRIVPFPALLTGTGPGGAVNESHIYRLPVFAVFPYNICAPALGIARGAVDWYIENAKRRSPLVLGERHFGYDALHLKMVEAAVRIDAAEITEIGRAGRTFTPEQQTRYGRDLSFAAQAFMQAVDKIFYTSGGHGLFEDNPIQRAFRDVHAVNAQIGLRWEMCAAPYAQAVLGLGAAAGH